MTNVWKEGFVGGVGETLHRKKGKGMWEGKRVGKYSSKSKFNLYFNNLF